MKNLRCNAGWLSLVIVTVLFTGCENSGDPVQLFEGSIELDVGVGNRSTVIGFPHENGDMVFNLHYDDVVLKEMQGLSHFEDGVEVSNGETAEEVIYALLLKERRHNDLIYSIMEALRVTSQELGLNEAQLAVDFVQNIPYDEFATVDKYPVETLLLGTGDCSDKSLLLGQILELMGYSCSLLLYSDAEHMALGLEVDEMREGVDAVASNVVYVESTTPHPIGRFPEDESNVNAFASPVSISVGLGGGIEPMSGFLSYLAGVDAMTLAFGEDYIYSNSKERSWLRRIGSARAEKDAAEQALDAFQLEFKEKKQEWLEVGCVDANEQISADCDGVVGEWNEYVLKINSAIQHLNQTINDFNFIVEEGSI